MTPAIELRDVERVFAGEPPVRAVAGVSLRIDRGQMTAIVGPSGSGKSTLLNLMGTLDRATHGSVIIDGTDARDLSDGNLSSVRARSIGFVFQQFHLIDRISARENVAVGLVYRGMPRSSRLKAADDALDRVGLADKRQVEPAKLSGGQRQRVAIARALVGEPSVVLADEPTGNLDSVTSGEIIDLLCELNHRHDTTVVIITHDNQVAERCPVVLKMTDGRIAPPRTHP